MTDIVNKLWGFCHTLRHDGVDYGDYIEQLTYLLFLKMADEKGIEVPKNCDWVSLKDRSGNDLIDHYADILRNLREAPGLLQDIFSQSVPRFNNPVNLKRVIAMIDDEDWSSMDIDVKGAAFEGLLERAASEGKKGAGQYFTPRVLIQSIVRVMKPDPRGKPDFKISENRTFNEEQNKWLSLIRDHMIQNLTIEEDDFDVVPIFEQFGGRGRARRVFGDQLPSLIEELNLAVAA